MRGVEVGDAAGLADTLTRNRAYMAPFEPWRSEVFFTKEGQAARIAALLTERDGGASPPTCSSRPVRARPSG